MKKTKCKDCNVNDRVNGRSYCQSCFWIRFGNKSNKKYAVYRKTYKDENRSFVHRYKQICGCQSCGEKRYWILDLHHIDPSLKDFDFFSGVSRNRDILKNEMRKCIVLCKNCHYDFHHQEKKQNINLNQYLNK